MAVGVVEIVKCGISYFLLGVPKNWYNSTSRYQSWRTILYVDDE